MPYQFKLTLLHSPVQIWRRFIIDEQYSFEDLHVAIQIVMGWEDCHLYQFKHKAKDGLVLVSPNANVYEDEQYVQEYQLSEIFKRVGQKVFYEYDFGDGWMHEVLFEKRIKEERYIPVCLEGEGACPPEDVGGVFGYEIMLKAIKNPKHDQYEEYREWLGLEEGEKYDVKLYDIEKVNAMLGRVFLSAP